MSELKFEDQDKILAIIEAAAGRHSISEYEIYCFQEHDYNVEAKHGEIDFFQNASEQGLALRLLADNKMGFSYTTDFSESALHTMVESAWGSAQTMAAEKQRRIPLVHQNDTTLPVLKNDTDLGDYSEADKIEMALSLEKFAKAFDDRVTRVRKSSYQESDLHIWLHATSPSSGPIHREARRRLCQIGVMAMAEKNGDQEMSWGMDFSEKFSELQPHATAEKVAADAVALLGAKPIDSVRCPVVLDREVVCSLLGVLSPSFLADHVQKGKSALAGKLGETIYSPQFNLMDDGVRPGGFVSFPFDGEGHACQSTSLVEGGVLKNFLYDDYTALQDGKKSTGNATRGSFKEMPQLGITNFFIPAGESTLQDLEQGLDRGLWIVDVIGIHTANPISGDFSVGAVGFWYEGGKRQFPVRGIAISGNLHQIFNQVEAVGVDLKFYHGIGAPSLRVAALDIGGK
jgi:PmbA protein